MKNYDFSHFSTSASLACIAAVIEIPKAIKFFAVVIYFLLMTSYSPTIASNSAIIIAVAPQSVLPSKS